MGRVYRETITGNDADGNSVKALSEKWYIRYTDATGKSIKRAIGPSREQAKNALTKALADVVAEKNGLPTLRCANLQCKELLAQWLTSLKNRASAAYLRHVEATVKRLLAETRASSIKTLTPDAVEVFLKNCQSRACHPERSTRI